MKKKIYITFGGAAYDKTTEKAIKNAYRFGADKILVYDDWWLQNTQKDFCEKNRWAFDHPHKRGFGWYIWKPYIIIDALNKANDGDIVLYCDADTYPTGDLSPLYAICEKRGGIMIFSAVGYFQRQWCKRDCFIVMNQDDPKYYDVPAGVARFMLFQKGSPVAKKFLDEWLMYTCDPRANTFDPSVLGPELAGFIEHRCEQAIMTNLAYKYGCRLFREACQLGNRYPYDKDLYLTLFHQEGSVAGQHKNKTAPVLGGSKFRNVE